MTILFSTDFDTSGEYAANVTLSANATHTHLPTGGWDGGGAAKFTPNDTYGSRTGITPPDFTDSNLVCTRVVYKFGSTFETAVPSTNKLIIIGRSTAADTDRGMFLTQGSSYQGPPIDGVVYHGFVSNNIAREPPNPILFNLQPYVDSGNWLCFEFRANVSGNSLALYVTDQAGTYNESLVDSTTLATTTGLWSGIDIIGGYCQAEAAMDANSYFILDSLVVADTIIGAPTGFVTSGASPSVIRTSGRRQKWVET